MRAPALAAWLAFVYLAWAASPAHYWLDSGEIGAAGFELGVAHPPGAPGLLMLLRVATLLPVGGLGFRMAVVSAALGAATVGLVVVMLQRRGASPWLAGVGGAWVVAGLTFVRNARVVEIYALAAVLLMVVLWGLDPKVAEARRTGRRLVAVAAAVWAAWCFGDLRLALGPLVIVLWVVAWRRREPWSRWAPAVVAMASLVVLALPLASVGAPVTDWGDPQTLGAWFDHLAARSIRESYADQILPASASMWQLNGSGVLSRLTEDLGAPGIVVAALALVLRLRRFGDPVARAETLALFWLVVVELVYAAGINPMGGADRQTGLVLAPLAALVVVDALRGALVDRPPLSWAVLPLATAVLVGPPLLLSIPDRVTTRSWAPHRWTRDALSQLPPGTLLLTQSDDLAAGTLHAALIEGARPDVISIPAQHLYRPTPQAAERDPRVAAVWDAAHEGTTEAERIAAAIAGHRGPVALELAGTGLFAGLPLPPPPMRRGVEPVMLVRGGTEPGSDVPVPEPPPRLVEYWSTRLPAAEDRRRLAITLAALARRSVQYDGALPLAIATLSLSLSQVYEPHPGGLVTLGALHSRAGQLDRAVALTERALQLEPGRHRALLNLSRYRLAQPGGGDDALAYAERAVALRPWKADGWMWLAQVHEARGEADAAARARERAADLGAGYESR